MGPRAALCARSHTTDGLGNTLEETMELPVLMNHEHDKPIGVVREQDGKLFVEFLADMKITKEAAFEIFGGVGLQVLEATEEDGVFYIRKARIIEFSLVPSAPVVPN